MQCISPILVRSAGKRDYVPCGKCLFCLGNKRADWSFRLQQELKRSTTAQFLTFTYDDDNIPINPDSCRAELRKRDVQLFKKRLRKRAKLSSNVPLRYYTVGEYGTETERPHYHSIMFNLPTDVYAELPSIWQKGHIHCGQVTMASIHYVTKYCINRIGDYSGREPPFSHMSKRPGIGSNYLDSHTQWHRSDLRNYTRVGGIYGRLPRYYKEKIFTDLERKKMAIESIYQADNEYWAEVERLKKFHSDPEAYYEECICRVHDTTKEKVNSTSKF